MGEQHSQKQGLKIRPKRKIEHVLSLKLLGYLPAFSRFGFLDGADAAASSSAALPTFCRASVACRTSDRLFNLFAAPERGLCFFPWPVGG